MPASILLNPALDTIADLLHDESKMEAAGVASVAVPETIDELRRVMRWHASRSHRITVSASRTGVAGGAVPDEGTHLVSVAALRGVVEIDAVAEPPCVTVLAGTTLSELNAHLAREQPGLVFPVDPTETTASIGGMVSTNASGARSYRFGAMREWVLALEVELASGNTLELRRGREVADGDRLALRDGDAVRVLPVRDIPKPPTKNAIGYAIAPGGDAVDLFVGAEGTLGVVSVVTIRLARMKESRIGALQFFDTPARAFDFVVAVRADASMRTTAIEFLDTRSHELARESGRAEAERVLRLAPDGSCSVFTELAWHDDDELAAIVGRLEDHVAAVGGDVRASIAGATDDELRDVRTFRHLIPERINAIVASRRTRIPGLHKIATDMAVPDSRLAWVYDLYHRRLTSEGLDFAIFGHVGNNHFHVNILPRDERELARAREIYAEFASAVVDAGGSVAAEHGIGRLKKGFLSLQYAQPVLDTMQAIKRWADPDWRLNPGVLLDP